MTSLETVDRIITWVIVPFALLAVLGEVVAGDYFHALLPATWAFLVFATNRELRGWRQRSNRWSQIEKNDRDRFSLAALTAKARVVNQIQQIYSRMGVLGLQDDGIEEELRIMYESVAATVIPDDAPEELHRLQRLALEVARTGRPVRLH